jgi:hypothetical protein
LLANCAILHARRCWFFVSVFFAAEISAADTGKKRADGAHIAPEPLFVGLASIVSFARTSCQPGHRLPFYIPYERMCNAESHLKITTCASLMLPPVLFDHTRGLPSVRSRSWPDARQEEPL